MKNKPQNNPQKKVTKIVLVDAFTFRKIQNFIKSHILGKNKLNLLIRPPYIFELGQYFQERVTQPCKRHGEKSNKGAILGKTQNSHAKPP